jgi:hypothetical protein
MSVICHLELRGVDDGVVGAEEGEADGEEECESDGGRETGDETILEQLWKEQVSIFNEGFGDGGRTCC